MIIRTDEFLLKLKEFRCSTRAAFANSRFKEHITRQDVCDVLFKYDFKCFYCNDRILKNSWQLDHFHPRANGGKNIPNNLVCTCKWCNTMKNALDGNAFINKCANILNNNFFTRKELSNNLNDKELNKCVNKIINKLEKLNLNYNEEATVYIKQVIENYIKNK